MLSRVRRLWLLYPVQESRLVFPPFPPWVWTTFGPMLVKSRRSQVKRYACVFTCLAIRAVHIEIAHDLTADSFIQAFTRFVSRRGSPIEVFSDNETTFKGAESEIKTALDHWNPHRIDNWKQAQYLADIFCKRWILEYLPTLAVGDLVLVVGKNSPRGHWPKGIVQEVFPDRHGTVRQVTVKTATSVLRRDIRKLYLLEGVSGLKA